MATTRRAGRIALVARTASDVRDVVVEGESGILRISPASERPEWNSSRRRLTWPNGAIATTYSADEPDQLRGPQHDAAWLDELASWRYPEAFDQLRFGLRLGERPQVVVTTTPRPTPIVTGLIRAPGTVVTRGRTRDHAGNLAAGVVADLERRYAGTRLGRQELDGEILTDAPGALWKWAPIEAARVESAPALRRVVVAIDPAATSGDESDETGIVVAGLGWDDRGDTLGVELGADGVAVVGFVHSGVPDAVARIEGVDERLADRSVSHRSRREADIDRIGLGSTHGMDFGGQSAPGAADGLIAFF